MNIGQTILSQIKTFNPTDLMCWGAEKFMTFESTQLITNESHQGGLLFKVNGMKYKGHVVVTLTHADTYTVRLGKFVASKGTFTQLGETKTDVYCDNLNVIIDSLVEGYYEKGSAVYKNVNLFKNV